MTFQLTWLPDVLRGAGLKVEVDNGFENVGRGEMGDVAGVICHHTNGSRNGNMPTLPLLRAGRPDLSGPLAQLGLGRDGTYFVIAAGRSNHAGAGQWQGFSGNSHFIGIEAENTGLPNDFPWPEVQMDAYVRGVAAILTKLGRGAMFCAGHKEYALPAGRKDDPSFDMNVFRGRVAAILNGTATGVALRTGDSGVLVAKLQVKLGVTDPGTFGPNTEAAVRKFQEKHGLTVDGIVGPETLRALDGN